MCAAGEGVSGNEQCDASVHSVCGPALFLFHPHALSTSLNVPSVHRCSFLLRALLYGQEQATGGDTTQQFQPWKAHDLTDKFVQLCYGSVKLNQVRLARA